MGNINKHYKGIANSSENNLVTEKLPLKVVDDLADALASEYDNQLYRPWYAGVITEFGVAQVEEWRRRASDGRSPGKIFSKYANEARTYKTSRGLGE